MSINKNAGTALIGLGILTIGGYAALTYLGSQKEKEAEFERTKQEEYEQKGLFGNIGDFLFGKNNSPAEQPANNANPVVSEQNYLNGINQFVIAAQNRATIEAYNLAHINDIDSKDVIVTYAANGRIDTVIDTKEHVLADTKTSLFVEDKASFITWDQLNKNTPLASYMK